MSLTITSPTPYQNGLSNIRKVMVNWGKDGGYKYMREGKVFLK